MFNIFVAWLCVPMLFIPFFMHIFQFKFTWSQIYCHFLYVTCHCLYLYAWATSLDRVHVWLFEHANWLYYMYSRVASDNPGFSCPDPRVWTVALLCLIRVAQQNRGLAVAYLDPPSSSLSLIGSRDSHLSTREYFPVFHIVHPAFVLLIDHIFLRYYIMPCDNCVLVLLLLECIISLYFRTLILVCTDA